MAIDANDLRLLTAAITQAIRQQGGPANDPSRRWDPIGSRIGGDGSPQDRAQQVLSSKYLEDNKKLMKELARMLAANTRSTDDLKKFNQVQEKTMQKALDAYNDIDVSTKELTKQLRKHLSAQDANVQHLKNLTGEVNTLADALSFSDLGKQMANLSKSLDAASDANADDITKAIESLEQTIQSKNGPNSGLQNISADLKRVSDEIRAIVAQNTRRATQDDVDQGRAHRIGDEIRNNQRIAQAIDQLRNDNRNRPAFEHLRTLAFRAQQTAIESNINAVRRSTSVFGESKKRLTEWTGRLVTAGFAIDQLAAAGKQLYNTVKIAGGTGTEKGIVDTMKRDFKAFVNGVSPEAMQEAQVKGARIRTSMGKESFNQALLDGMRNFNGVTYDRDEALKMQQATLSNIGRSGVNVENTKTAAASKELRESFLKLQAMTGMTGAQMAELNTEMASDVQFRQGLMLLSEKERAATVIGITKMFEENAQRNISIEQTKAMVKAQLALSDAHSPKTRLKNAAKMRALGGAVGVNTEDAAQLILASGNDGLMKKRLMNKGATEAEADARVKNARLTQEKIGTMAEKALSENDGRGLMYESLLNNTGTKDWALSAGQTLNEAGKLQKQAADKMMEAAIKMGEVNPILNGIEAVANSLGTITGKLLMAAGALGAGLLLRKQLGGLLGPITRALPQRFRPSWLPTRSGPPTSGLGSGAPSAVTPGGTIGTVGVPGGAAANQAAIPRPPAASVTGINAAATGGMTSTAPGVGTVGRVGIPRTSAANAASAAGSVGVWSTLTNGFAKIAKPLTVLTGVVGAGSALYNGATAEEKGSGAGGAIGGAAGGWYGAAGGAKGGAILGSMIAPGIGTAAGAVIGGILGGLAGSWAGDAAGSKIGGGIGGLFGGPNTPVARTTSPVNPSVSPTVNTPSSQTANNTAAAQAVNPLTGQTVADETSQRNAAREAQAIQTQRSLDQMNQTLASILTALQEQTTEIGTGTDKTISMQERLTRALKARGFAAAASADGGAGNYMS